MHAGAKRTTRVLAVAVAAWLGLAPSASAQGALGLGARLSIVQGDPGRGVEPTRYPGGYLRARLSPKTALEISLDYRSRLAPDLAERVRDRPIQGSLVMYLLRAVVAPYLVAGVGWYTQHVDRLDGARAVVSTTTTRTMGYHAGVGGELRLGAHAAIHLDYRYTFIRFGSLSPGAQPGAIPIPGTRSFQERLKLSHQGSVWTSGLTVYF
jgi:hypothetical protein